LQSVIDLFEHAKTFGSLIQVPADQADFLKDLNKQLQALIEQGNSFQKPAAKTLLPFVQQAHILAMKFDAVFANPPYMGGKGMNPELKVFAQKNFPNSKSDMFSMFMERCLDCGNPAASLAFVTPYVWMFISSYEGIRSKLLTNTTLQSLIQLEYNAFEPACVPVCTFIVGKTHVPNYTGSYIKLSDFKGHENQAPKTLEAIKNNLCSWFYNAKPDDFKKISGSPVAYWVSDKVRDIFENSPALSEVADARQGLATTDNDRFLRLWHEIDMKRVGFGIANGLEAQKSGFKWFPYNKGGAFRKWYGNQEFVVNWENDGQEIKDNILRKYTYLKTPDFVAKNQSCYFQTSISWSKITSGSLSIRFFPTGFIFSDAGMAILCEDSNQLINMLGILNSQVSFVLLSNLSPTLNFEAGTVNKFPLKNELLDIENTKKCIELAKTDWNNYETSWDFTETPLIRQKQPTLKAAFEQWQTQNRAAIAEMKRLEEENNSLFIDAYGLQDELSPDVPEAQITLVLADREKDIQRLVSYAIGCMMGRYSLDVEGLIYAHVGNIDFDPTCYQTFTADDDGIIPLTDQDWFKDDATNRFRDFVRTVLGEDNLQENLAFVAESLCLGSLTAKRGEQSLETIRRYLSNQFYKDHLKTYKKRPIYWLFSSGKQKAFEGLVYLHRYNDSTLPRMRTEYVTPLLGKYDAFADQLKKQLEDATTSEATLLNKELLALEKKQTELRAFDDNLKHYADRRIKLDLDDGVKVNYGKFGDLLVDVKAVTGGKE
jgi:type II restriction/modification system DNA methylase subunit YeeA